MKPAIFVMSPDGPLFLNPSKVPNGVKGYISEIPESESYDEI